MLTKWTEIELFWLSTAKRLTDEERVAALDEYRRTGGMVDVVMAEPNPEDLSAEECERLSEVGPKSDEIDWTGFDAAEVTDAQIEALRSNAAEAGDLEQVDICDRALGRLATADEVIAALSDVASAHRLSDESVWIWDYAPDSDGASTEPGSAWDEECDALLESVRDVLPAGWSAEWSDDDVRIDPRTPRAVTMTRDDARAECARVIDEARSNAAQFQVQIRRVGIGGRWTPGVHGTLNQTGQSDAFASSFEREAEAFEAAAMVRLEMGEEYEVRVADIG